jgi:hypothetical protein
MDWWDATFWNQLMASAEAADNAFYKARGDCLMSMCGICSLVIDTFGNCDGQNRCSFTKSTVFWLKNQLLVAIAGLFWYKTRLFAAGL